MSDTTTEEIRRDHDTATAALRDLLAETEGARRNGLAGDGRGWFQNQSDRDDCYAVADAMLPLLTPGWEYGVYYNRNDSDVHICDDQDHATEWKRDLHWDGPVVRRLTARLVGQDWAEANR
ncbi:hypothetical protein AB0J14_05105 [Micromonospora arborensis]|uniref:hypothetical protein n=1 Tax=Micromonospora arborensis TaxID=2116518 RepID=UPI0033D26690